MADYVEVAKEIDRLFTEGHQDLSIMAAIQRLFPEVTLAEFETAVDDVMASRRGRVERTRQAPVERDDKGRKE